MITRWMLIKFAAPEGGFAATAAWLAGLGGPIHRRQGRPADPKSASSWDLALALDFETSQALEQFLGSEALAGFIAAQSTQGGAVIKAWSFDFDA